MRSLKLQHPHPNVLLFEEQKKVLQDLEKAVFPPKSEESQESEEGEERYLDRLCFKACISGEINVGKSTLFNALSGRLVSPISHSGHCGGRFLF